PLLQQVAQAYAEELLARGRFGHVSPESGKVSDRLRRAGYDFRIAGENLGEGPSPAVAHRAIVQSPAHLSAILEPRFESIGIGAARSDAHARTVEVHVPAAPRPNDELESGNPGLIAEADDRALARRLEEPALGAAEAVPAALNCLVEAVVVVS